VQGIVNQRVRAKEDALVGIDGFQSAGRICGRHPLTQLVCLLRPIKRRSTVGAPLIKKMPGLRGKFRVQLTDFHAVNECRHAYTKQHQAQCGEGRRRQRDARADLEPLHSGPFNR
jgi:hypothetical protein